MIDTYIFGHKNPDTDTICSALAYAKIKNKLGENVIAAKLGDTNEETNYVLNYLNIEAPSTIDSVKGSKVIMVDNNEFSQSIDDIEDAEIIEVVDHHRVANFKTESPLYMNVQPVGCTATILYEIAISNNVEIDEELAVILMSAIISDSLLFNNNESH